MKKVLHNAGTFIRIFYLRYQVIFGIIAVTTMLVASIFPVISGMGWIAFLTIVSMLIQDFVRDVFGPCKKPLEFWR